MIVERMKQYTPEYWSAKNGKPSSSCFSKFVTLSGQKSKSWKDSAYKLAAEIEMGFREETYKSAAMQRGLDLEGQARIVYNIYKNRDDKGEEVGLIFRDEDRKWCCSPDGLYTNNGLEIKCPSAGVHMKYKHEGVLPTVYKNQVYGSLWICDEVESWDFFSFHPDISPFLITVDRNDLEYQIYAEALEEHLPDIVEFIKDVACI